MSRDGLQTDERLLVAIEALAGDTGARPCSPPPTAARGA